MDTNSYEPERNLMENDPYLLEEHRYLDRLKNMELRQNQKTEKHYIEFTLPDYHKKRYQEEMNSINEQKRRITK